MENKLVSVIVPVYNGEQYIGRCIQSLLRQTYSSLEIIVVDDGSIDKTNEICMQFACTGKISVVTTPNTGVSHARNIGIAKATGKYITFIDSDDYVEDTYIEVLVGNMEKYNADMSVCNYNYVTNDCPHPIAIPQKFTGELDRKTFMEGLAGDFYRGFLWNKMFRTAQIKNSTNPIVLDESITICEDLLFVISVAEFCKKIFVDPRALYNYIQVSSSAYNSPFKESRLTEIKAYDRIISVVTRVEPELLPYYKVAYVKMALKIKEAIITGTNMPQRKRQWIDIADNAINKYFHDVLGVEKLSALKKGYFLFYKKYPLAIHKIKIIYHKIRF